MIPFVFLVSLIIEQPEVKIKYEKRQQDRQQNSRDHCTFSALIELISVANCSLRRPYVCESSSCVQLNNERKTQAVERLNTHCQQEGNPSALITVKKCPKLPRGLNMSQSIAPIRNWLCVCESRAMLRQTKLQVVAVAQEKDCVLIWSFPYCKIIERSINYSSKVTPG